MLSIISYNTVEEAIEIANDTVYGLGAHVQGTDMETVRAVAGEIRSGQVHVNYPDWDPNAPFGGYKRSGNGREYGLEGFGRIFRDKGRSRILLMKLLSSHRVLALVTTSVRQCKSVSGRDGARVGIRRTPSGSRSGL